MLNEVLRKYLSLFPEDKPKLKLLLEQIKADEALNTRTNFRGHIAGDALVLSPDHKKILYIFHKHSGRWQQPGGHWDPDEIGPWETASREALEETGVKIASRVNLTNDERVPLHIVTGPVQPSKPKNEPKHWHHDFRYAFVAANDRLGEIQDPGIGGAKWVTINEALSLKESGHRFKASLRRLIKLIS